MDSAVADECGKLLRLLDNDELMSLFKTVTGGKITPRSSRGKVFIE